jgi:hypothetical protein
MLWRAKSDADAKQAVLAQTHNSLDSQVHAGDPVTAAAESTVVAQAAHATTAPVSHWKRSHEESKSLVKAAMDQSSKQSSFQISINASMTKKNCPPFIQNGSMSSLVINAKL